MCPHKGKQISKEKVKGNPGSCTSFILFTSCYCNDGAQYVIDRSARLHHLDHCYSTGFMWSFFSFVPSFYKKKVSNVRNLCKKDYCHLIRISVSSLIGKAPQEHTRARSPSPSTIPYPSFLTSLRKRKRISCCHLSDTRSWWNLGWLSFNYHISSLYSSHLTVIK